MDEFISLFEEDLRLFKRGQKTGKVVRFHFTDKFPRIGKLATNLPLALHLIESLRRGKYAQKFVDLALCVCGVKRHESKWTNEIAFESSDHVCRRLTYQARRRGRADARQFKAAHRPVRLSTGLGVVRNGSGASRRFRPPDFSGVRSITKISPLRFWSTT